MRAFQLTRYNGPDDLRVVDLPTPEPTDSDVLINVRAIGINFPDLLMTKGEYQYRPELPVVAGCEVAGEVEQAPAGSVWSPGERVAAFVWEGGFAEKALVPHNSLVRVPDDVTLESAAAMVVNYHTVHFALARRGRVRTGETAFVMGAAGGIGTAAVQVATGLGARAIAGVQDESQVATAQAAGAADVVVLDQNFSARLRQLTEGRGVDIVLDPLGDWLFDEGLRSLAPEGRVLVVGFAAGQIPQVKANRLLLRNASVVGVAFGAFLGHEPGLMPEQAASLGQMAAKGTVRPQIGARFAFEDLPQALHRLEQGEMQGKGVALV